MSEKIRVGVIGCGAISPAYLGMARSFPVMEIAACADIDTQRAKARANEFGVPNVYTVQELLADDSIHIVLNLTVPKAHAQVSLEALNSGKHVYLEKPLGIDREEGKEILAAAKKRNLRVGCAPDTFMGAGLQTARQVIQEGRIGRPVAVTSLWWSGGHESWHPAPEFYYEVGGGPMMDMGPYYLTALVNLLGPVKRLSGAATFAIPERTITHKDSNGQPGPKFGKKIPVQTPDHICGTIEFENGASGPVVTSYAMMYQVVDKDAPIAVFGTEGVLKVPDPNRFDNPVFIRLRTDKDWQEVPLSFVKGYGRSVGLADMAYAISSGRPHRASGQQALYVLDLMQGFLDSSRSGKAYTPKAKYQQPAPMSASLPFGILDD